MSGRWGLRGWLRRGLRPEATLRSVSGIPRSSVILALIWMGCAGSHPGSGVVGPSVSPTHHDFSGSGVLENVKALSAGPAGPGAACESVSKRLRSRLRALGATTEGSSLSGQGTESPGAAGEVIGVLRGVSSDPILLVAPYTEACGDRPQATSGFDNAAFLLEVGRVLSRHPRPYSVWLVFVPGKPKPSEGFDGMGAAHERPWTELSELVSQFREAGLLQRVRLAVFFDGLGGGNPAALRDSHSHPVYREVFWESARDLGREDLFAEDAFFSSSQRAHHAFTGAGLRRTVMITTDGGTAAGAASSASDPGSPRVRAQAFQSLGEVSVEAIARIQERLARLDSFSVPSGSEQEGVDADAR